MNKTHIVRKTLVFIMALSLTVSLSACNKSKKNRSVNSGSVMSEVGTDVFSENTIEVPEEFSGTPEFMCSSDKIYLSGYSEPTSGHNVAVTSDMSTGETEKIDVSAIDSTYITAQCMNKDIVYLSYHNDDNNFKLCALNIKTGEIAAEVQTEADCSVISMQFDQEKNRIITLNAENSGQSVVQSLNEYDPITLELINSVDLTEKLSLGENDYIFKMLINNEGGYYIVSYNMISSGSEYTLYKYNSDLENIYTVSEFGNTPGNITDAFISSDSSVCIVTVDYDNSKCYINKLNAADGQPVKKYDISGKELFSIFTYDHVEGYDFIYSEKDGIYGYIMEDDKSVLLASVEKTGSEFEYCTGVSVYDNKLFMLTMSHESVNKKNVYVFDNEGKQTDMVEISADKPEGYIEVTGVSSDGTIYAIEAFSDEDQDNYSINYDIHVVDNKGKIKKTYSPDELSNMQSTYIEKILLSPDNDLYMIMSQYQSSGEEKIIMVFDSEGNLKNQIIPNTDVFDIIFNEENNYVVYKDKDGKVSLSAIDYQNNKTGEQINLDVPEILQYSFYCNTGKYDAFYKTSDGIYGYNIKEKKSTGIFDQKKSETSLTPGNYFVMNEDKIACSVFDADKGSSSYYILTRD